MLPALSASLIVFDLSNKQSVLPYVSYGFTHVILALRHCTLLQHLKLGQGSTCKAPQEQFTKALVSTLPQLPQLRVLDISHVCGIHFPKLLPTFTLLGSSSSSSSAYSTSSPSSFSSSSPSSASSSLLSLNLSGNYLAAPSILQYRRRPHQLAAAQEQEETLAHALSAFTLLEHLDLCHVSLQESFLRCLCSFTLPHLRHLQELKLTCFGFPLSFSQSMQQLVKQQQSVLQCLSFICPSISHTHELWEKIRKDMERCIPNVIIQFCEELRFAEAPLHSAPSAPTAPAAPGNDKANLS